ncbi:MAG TPA: chorismate-binding protein [Streptosporangiaceae bacterium]
MEADLEDHAWTDTLAVSTIAIADPGDLITRLPEPAAVAWVRRGEGLIGWGEAARITLPAGVDRFTVAEKWFRSLLDSAEVDDQVGIPGSGPVAFGSFSFDPTSDGSVLTLPRVVLGRRDGQAWLTTIGAPGGPGEIVDPSPVVAPGRVRWHDGSLTAPQWQRAVAAAVSGIKAGRLRKVVLARDLYATAPEPLDPRVLLHRLAARYPDCYTFACCGLVGATPELLVRREAAEISALVLAGTTPRGKDAGSDQALGAALLASAKDIEEHGYAVAGVRQILTPLCARLDVDPSPFLLKLANVQHLATAVTGTLAPQPGPAAHQSPATRKGPAASQGPATQKDQDTHQGPAPSSLAVAAALHPTAAVCGTPTETAMELIRDLEGMDRGRYAGPVGWLDAQGNGEWGIAMRCAEVDGARARLFAGCGIVAGSDPAAELAEAQAKFKPMQDALEGRD